ncbi:hypothetical protein CHH77_02485 [Shouchella clausii]|nr:hypothetical protein CHH73_00480 [Shouchella clausii]PAE85038.1 hypothetical protein CHH77_02485 [Shouchella clausii]
MKIEFVSRRAFPNQHELDLALFDYVHWFNHIRSMVHSTIYHPLTIKPNTFKNLSLLC